MNRRSFIKHGAFVGGSFLTYGNVFASSNNNPNPDDTAVLFVFLNGGATHIETFNPVPQAPVEFRSTTGAIDTNVPGLQVGGLFKNLAQRANKGNRTPEQAGMELKRNPKQPKNIIFYNKPPQEWQPYL